MLVVNSKPSDTSPREIYCDAICCESTHHCRSVSSAIIREACFAASPGDIIGLKHARRGLYGYCGKSSEASWCPRAQVTSSPHGMGYSFAAELHRGIHAGSD